MNKLDKTLIDSLSTLNINNNAIPTIGNIKCLMTAVQIKYKIFFLRLHLSSSFLSLSPYNPSSLFKVSSPFYSI